MAQRIVSGAWFPLDTTQTAVESIWGGHSWDFTSVEHGTPSIMSVPGTFSDLRIKMTNSLGAATGPGTGDSYIFTLYKNDVATDITVTISGSDTEGSDIGNTVSVSAGDTLYIHCEPTGTPSANYVTFSLTFTPTSNTDSIYGYAGAVWFKNQPTQYDFLVPRGSPNATENLRQQIVATSGKFKNLRVVLHDNPGSGIESYKMTLRVDGVSKALSVEIVGADTSGEDLVNEVSVTAGQKVCWLIEATDVPTNNVNARAGFAFEADNPNESLFINGFSPLDDTNTEYHPLSHNLRAWDVDEYKQRQLTQLCKVSKLYVRLNDAPGTDKSFTFRLRVNGVDTALSCTISDAATTGNDIINSVTVNNDDYVDWKVTPSGTPTATPAFFSALQTSSVATLPRVTALVHRWSAGPDPVDQLEILTGGLFSDYFSPVSDPEPTPTMLDPQLLALPTHLIPTGDQFIRWMKTHTPQEMMEAFGPEVIHAGKVTFRQWQRWMINRRAMGQDIP